MKAHRFKLEQALRWRETQASLAEIAVQSAARRLAELENNVRAISTEVESEARDLVVEAAGSRLALWPAYRASAHRKIDETRAQIREAERELGGRMQALMDAKQKLELLLRLRESGLAVWRAAHAKELETFAGEAFLARYNREDGRARSSGG